MAELFKFQFLGHEFTVSGTANDMETNAEDVAAVSKLHHATAQVWLARHKYAANYWLQDDDYIKAVAEELGATYEAPPAPDVDPAMIY